MRSNWLFTALAVTSLALGIGANTAIYSFMDWILVRSLPVADPQSLVVMNWRAKIPRLRRSPQDPSPKVWHAVSGRIYGDPTTGITAGILPYPVFDLFRSEKLFSSVFGFCPARRISVSGGGQAETAGGMWVTGDYFRALGGPPAAGRLLTPDDDRPGAAPAAVLSHAFSRKRFGSAEAAPGQTILINTVPFTVAGVTPPEFFGVSAARVPDVYLPMQASLVVGADPTIGDGKAFHDRNYYWLEIMGRLRPGVTIDQAQAALAFPFRQWMETTAGNAEERANLPALYLREGAAGLDELRRQFSKPLYVLLQLVGLILAIRQAVRRVRGPGAGHRLRGSLRHGRL